MTNDLLFTNATIATMAVGEGAYGRVPGGALSVRDGRITAVGPMGKVDGDAREVIDLGGRLLTPGLVDCHTHLVFAGNRVEEFEARLAGTGYEELNRSGGGIASTVRATREADIETLVGAALHRVNWLAREGVTTVEVKSGYGLDLDTELRMLEAARQVGLASGVDVRPTLLAAHAVPVEYRDRRDEYVTLVCEEIIPAAVGRATAVDVFCESIGFTGAETRRIFEAAAAHGLPVKVHADQLTRGEGCRLAAEFGALSADHLECTDESGVRALAAAGTTAVLIPAASAFLDERARPPVESLRRHGVGMAVATDLNPGTAPIGSPTLAMSLACTRFGLTPEEALTGMTRAGAAALGLADRGVLAPGLRADLAAWDVSNPAELAYWFGAPLCLGTWVGGRARPSPPTKGWS